MSIHVQPQEIYLLERYSSIEYFGELRDHWDAMVKHVEACLEAYMRDLPRDYRSRHLSEQPDVAWGQRALPNFRDTRQGLNEGYIFLSHHDFKGLHYAWGPSGDYKGQLDYSTEWMPRQDEALYQELLEKASAYAHNICMTEGALWRPTNLLKYTPERGPLNRPDRWPTYTVNREVCIASGMKVPRSGIYVPDVDNSCAQFLSSRYPETPGAQVWVGTRDILNPVTGEKWDEELILEKRPCTWYLVERVMDGESTALPIDAYPAHVQRYAEGESCHADGFYFTPARPRSRRFFNRGEIFPGFDAAYGKTIWQWDESQV